MTTGTCYFPSYGAALRYYRPYCEFEDLSKHAKGTARTCALRDLINRKLNEGEIHIGKPPLCAGQTLSIQDNRYHITEDGALSPGGSE